MSPSSLPDEFFIERAMNIVENVKQRGGVARIIGGLAILIHSMEYKQLFHKFRRLGNEGGNITDIDLVTYKSSLSVIDAVMQNIGYVVDYRILMFYGDSRRVYHAADKSHQVDVFIDHLKYNHLIEFRTKEGGRLELDYPTAPLSDLLLEKLQIHYIAEKDIKDIVLLLRSHKFTTDDLDAINLKRLEDVLGKDWGFWYDAKLNLEKTLSFVQKYVEERMLDEESAEDVSGKITHLLKFLEDMPKASAWWKRAKVGTKKKWWNEIE